MANGNGEAEKALERRAVSAGEGGIRISNRELYDMLIQVRDRTASLENRIDHVLGENVELRKRVRSLELKFYGILAGLIAAGGSIFLGAKIVGGGT